MTRTLACLTLLAAFAASTASAKGITSLRLCGEDGCTTVALPRMTHEFPGGGGDPTYPPAAGPFLDIELAVDGSRTERLWYVPGADVFAVRDGTGSIRWTTGGVQDVDRLIAAAARTITPHRPRAVAALVDGRRVDGDASGYLGLFGVESAGFALAGSGRQVPISVKTEPASPWALTGLWFYPDDGLLQRGADLIRLPEPVAADLRAVRPVGGGGAPFDWPLVVGALAAAGALALAAAGLARRARLPQPKSSPG